MLEVYSPRSSASTPICTTESACGLRPPTNSCGLMNSWKAYAAERSLGRVAAGRHCWPYVSMNNRVNELCSGPLLNA